MADGASASNSSANASPANSAGVENAMTSSILHCDTGTKQRTTPTSGLTAATKLREASFLPRLRVLLLGNLSKAAH